MLGVGGGDGEEVLGVGEGGARRLQPKSERAMVAVVVAVAVAGGRGGDGGGRRRWSRW